MVVMDSARQMSGKGAPTPTLFGVIGKTMMDSENRVLGGLVQTTTKGAPIPKHMSASKAPESEKCIVGPASKTPMARAHYGQTPYVGRFMGREGSRLS